MPRPVDARWVYRSPIGALSLEASADRLGGLRFAVADAETQTKAETCLTDRGRPDGVLGEACGQLDAYFAGELEAFDLPLAPAGTGFQRAVWSALQDIPFGQTISYRELAERVGRPGAARAVGSANGANPIAVIIPCHRVIASDGSLAGFAGGVQIKRALLDHERAGAGLFHAAAGER